VLLLTRDSGGSFAEGLILGRMSDHDTGYQRLGLVHLHSRNGDIELKDYVKWIEAVTIY
jgi:hypothetical protein